MAVAARVPLLQMEGISKAFGAVQALSDVCFDVYAGEVVALVGDNGAGKSTLIKAIAGIHAIDAGTIKFEGREVHIHTPNDSKALGISTVYQDLALCDNLDVVGNLYLGREVHPSLFALHPRLRSILSPLLGLIRVSRINRLRVPGPVQWPFRAAWRILGPTDETGMEKKSVEVLRRLSVKIPSVRTPIAMLSGGQRQSVAVARAVLWDSKVVLLDEPTAALGVAQTKEVLDLVKRLRDEGHGVVIISHNLVDVYEVADRIIVLRLGRYVGTYEAAKTDRELMVGLMTGAVAGAAPINPDLIENGVAADMTQEAGR
jgi:D-xylose transport system ATP-binding protein